ncbi:MAG: tryptophan synthase subunit alpha, partial [Phycisphaerae bacterium]
RASSGFVYRIAVAGTTGERSQRPRALAEDVARLQTAAALPVCVGFGISKPDHVRHVCRFADGAIVGSALVRRINEAVSQRLPRHAVIDTAGDFIADLMSGLTDDA